MSSSLRPAVPACMGKHVLLKVCWLKLIYSLNMKYIDAPARWDSSNIFIISSPFSRRLFMAGICSRDSCVALGTALLMSATFVRTEMSLYLFDGLRWNVRQTFMTSSERKLTSVISYVFLRLYIRSFTLSSAEKCPYRFFLWQQLIETRIYLFF